MKYLCELIGEGIIQGRFYRDGTSREEVKAGLEMFQWPDGAWKIQPAMVDPDDIRVNKDSNH